MGGKSRTRFTEMPPLAYGSIKDEIRNLPEAVFNKLDREWPSHWPREQGPRDLLRGLVRTSQYTYRAILHLISDDPDPNRRPEYVIALPPLVRSLLDTLIALVLLLDDLSENSRWYFRAGWRELSEAQARYMELFGDDPVWSEWVTELEPMIERMRRDFGISAGDAASPAKALPYWPYPSQVPGVKKLSAERAEFIDYLLAAHYRDLSQDAHLSWPGFLRRAAPLLHPAEEQLAHLRQDWYQIGLALLLAILSELEMEAQWDLGSRLAYLWGILGKYHSFAEAIHEMRYSSIS